MKLSRAQASVVAAVSFQGSWVKILQARVGPDGPLALLGMKAKHVGAAGNEETAAAALQELVTTLPAPPQEVVGLLSTAEVFTRYLSLPSEDPRELSAMALYQLEGALPFPIQECVTAVKILGPVGEATRVFIAAAHRPVVERLLRVCAKAGLRVSRIGISSETTGYWHRACRFRQGTPPDAGWLFAEISREGMDLGVLVKGELVYMRQVPRFSFEFEELVGQLQETLRAYEKERIGPSVREVSLSGALEPFGPSLLERLEGLLELPVHRVDPLERSPFTETLSMTAQDLSQEVSFTELLGTVCAPRLLGLDLVPVETRRQRQKESLLRELRITGVLAAAAGLIVAAWLGVKVGGTWHSIRQVKQEIRLLEPTVARIQAMEEAVRAVRMARQIYASQMASLSDATQRLLPGMTLQFLSVEERGILTVRGTAPQLSDVTRYADDVRTGPLWSDITLQSARAKKSGAVEFEMSLHAAAMGQRGNE